MRAAAKTKARAAAEARKRAGGPSSGRAGPSDPGPRSGGAGWRPFDAPPEPPPWSDDPVQEAVDRLRAAVFVHMDGRKQGGEFAAARACPPSSMRMAIETMLLTGVAMAWSCGWQPAELHRQAKRGCDDAKATRLIHLAIAADHANRRAATLDPRWMAQVDQLGLPETNGRPGFVGRWADEQQLDHHLVLRAGVDAMVNLCGIPTLEPILPPPGSDRAAFQAASSTKGADADPVLERIRALLAKAESTPYEAEASALTAKAQELMTRHAIDAAAVAARGGVTTEAPVVVRLPVDSPYADAKSLLLQFVAEANRCRAIAHGGLGLSAVIGLADDVAATELLFTSLLLQAQGALAAAAKTAPPGTRVRSQSYRSAFLLAYAQRIGDRLDEANRAVLRATAEEEPGRRSFRCCAPRPTPWTTS
ncbi:MAG: DUF2786 domain-containing protein [Acidimicrobiales bacterium]